MVNFTAIDEMAAALQIERELEAADRAVLRELRELRRGPRQAAATDAVPEAWRIGPAPANRRQTA